MKAYYYSATILLGIAMVLLVACGKTGAQLVGNWAQIHVPAGCEPQQIAAEQGNGVAILCKDGRVFH